MKEREMSQNTIRENEQLPNNITSVETPDGIFRIIYGIHIFTENKASVEDVDGLVLESGGENYTTSTQAERMINGEYGYRTGKSYKEIIKQCEENNIPIFLSDLSSWFVPLMISTVSEFMELYVGLPMVYSGVSQILRNEKVLSN